MKENVKEVKYDANGNPIIDLLAAALNEVKTEAIKEWKPKTFFGRLMKFIASAITPKDVYNVVVKK